MDEAPSRPSVVPRGAHEYMFVVDGQWGPDPSCAGPRSRRFGDAPLSAVAVRLASACNRRDPFRFSQPSPPCPAGWARRTRSPQPRRRPRYLAGAGPDSNMFLQITPDPAAGCAVGLRVGFAVWHRRLAGALAWPSWRLGLAYRLATRLGRGWLDVAARRRAFPLAMPALEGCVPGSA